MNNEQEYHIASFVAHAKQDKIANVCQAIEALPSGEVHAKSELGKIVFTLEAQSQKQIGKLIDELKNHAEILNLAPVYHQFLTEQHAS